MLKDQVLGCMVGGAVGDALGYAVEFSSWPQIRSKYGDKGITRYELDRRGLAQIWLYARHYGQNRHLLPQHISGLAPDAGIALQTSQG